MHLERTDGQKTTYLLYMSFALFLFQKIQKGQDLFGISRPVKSLLQGMEKGFVLSSWKSGIQGKCWRILRALYVSVSNKVLFGDVEAETFEQGDGFKQGCVLSPTLFSVLMNDD